jgi:hypothetical protein
VLEQVLELQQERVLELPSFSHHKPQELKRKPQMQLQSRYISFLFLIC